jgi:error-prone DNA polymerase
MTEDYVEFHARSAFSFLEGASLPEALVEQAAKLGMSALGILDRDGLYGAPRLYTTAKKLALRSHVLAYRCNRQGGNRIRSLKDRYG